MVQSYLVSDEDNKRLNNNSETIDWLLNLLKTAAHADKSKEPGLVFDDVEIIQVHSISYHTSNFTYFISGIVHNFFAFFFIIWLLSS